MLLIQSFKQSYKKLGYGFQINILSTLIILILKWIEIGEGKPSLVAIFTVLTPIIIVILVLSIETLTIFIKAISEPVLFTKNNVPNDNKLMEKILQCSQIISNQKNRKKVKESEIHIVVTYFIYEFYPKIIALNDYPTLCKEELIKIINHLNAYEDKLEKNQRDFYRILKQTTEFNNYMIYVQQNTLTKV